MVKVLLLALFVFSPDAVSSFSLRDGGTASKKKMHDYDVDKVDLSEDAGNRRLLLSSMLSASTIMGASSPSPVYAAKGAAEYDLEYYMRDLL